MRFVSILMCSFLALACEENLDQATPDGAMHQLRDAIMKRDTEQLLALSSSKTHELLAQLQALLKQQGLAVKERYPDEHRHAAKLAYPKGVLESTDAKALFAALVEPGFAAQDTGDGLRYGMTVMGAPTVEGDRADVATQNGETVKFLQQDGVWKTTVFERAIEANLNRARLNQQTLEWNLNVFGELKRRAEGKKKKTPPKPDGAEPTPPPK